MASVQGLKQLVLEHFSVWAPQCKLHCNELTVEIEAKYLLDFALQLREHPAFSFEQLIDICGIDYKNYKVSEWTTFETTSTGFSRGVEVRSSPSEFLSNQPYPEEVAEVQDYSLQPESRFAVIYHLLSVKHNHRMRIRVYLKNEAELSLPSVNDIWNSANWFEREAYDLFGIIFTEHPDLRRILTDYGFVGHPFRKDFPLIGNVEVRYDATLRRVIYEPVSIEPRTLVPKVIRRDHRYESDADSSS